MTYQNPAYKREAAISETIPQNNGGDVATPSRSETLRYKTCIEHKPEKETLSDIAPGKKARLQPRQHKI
ncbi:MAG: hypothetical protein IAC54_02895 [Bacteroidetes bacterium]|uniref:Uncharacterized protein n=1 Tax=Candidatus Caccoplasma merdipullorum TaxID=2840718 RepID=A0A9D9E339_9BACT|nr:hypothetical protein [Candidatus Caccoplasma merdipullorum]